MNSQHQYGTVIVKKENSIWSNLTNIFFRDDYIYIDENADIIIEFDNPDLNKNEMSDRNTIIDTKKLDKTFFSLDFINETDHNEFFNFYTYRDFNFTNKSIKKMYKNNPHQKFFYEKNYYYDLPQSFANFHKINNMPIITTIFNNCYCNEKNENVLSMCCNANGENYVRISFEYLIKEFTKEEISFIISEIMKKYTKY